MFTLFLRQWSSCYGSCHSGCLALREFFDVDKAALVLVVNSVSEQQLGTASAKFTYHTMSNIKREMESLTILEGAPLLSSGQPTKARRVSDIIDLTLSDEEEDPESDDGHDDNNYETEPNNDCDMIMPDHPRPAFGNPSSYSNAQTEPSAVLPRGIRWPEIIIKGKHTSKCLNPRQFVNIHTFARRLDAQNPTVAFTIPRYRAAWVYAVNQSRDQVDLTATFQANPDLDERSFGELIDREFEIVLRQIDTAILKTRAQKIEDIRDRIQQAQGDFKLLSKLRRKELMLINPKNRWSKTEKGAAGDATESFSRTPRSRPGMMRRSIDDEDFHTERRPSRCRDEVMQNDGTWGTAINAVPTVRKRIVDPNTRSNPPPDRTLPDRTLPDHTNTPRSRDQYLVPPPILIPASSWYSPSNARPSRTMDAGYRGYERNDDFTWMPYTPCLDTLSRFSHGGSWQTHPIADSYRPQRDSYRPREESYLPREDFYRPGDNIYSPREDLYRPRKDSYRPASPQRGLPLRPRPELDHTQDRASNYAQVPAHVPARNVVERERGWEEEKELKTERARWLPESRDEHMKYYV
ncbi:hypothetical protein BKA65DRAFT_592864 [Rhexocercosporidium sp. MPI-PUGE-AT-0058]|nr:hypothetical protein BKA65DRAFT_592864 [Rhexocercosporidium sp. MPI-PUGE-AT-0058]